MWLINPAFWAASPLRLNGYAVKLLNYAAEKAMSQILVCDIGNTSTKIGVADRDGLKYSFILGTDAGSTVDSLGFKLLNLASFCHFKPGDLEASVISSVVPQKTGIFREAIARYLDCDCLVAPDTLPVPLKISYENPREVGSDRIIGAWGARTLFPEWEAMIVVDYGTAVTFDCVKGDEYLGGLIFPGPAIALDALEKNTAKLPMVSLEGADCEPVPGRDTVTSIRHGIVFGFAALTEGLCQRLKRQLPDPVRIIATGGFAALLSGATKIFDEVRPNLVLEALRLLYYRQSKK